MRELIPTEHQEQCALMEWSAKSESKYPELRMLHAIPNGGKRAISVARKLKAEGVKPGVPDLDLPVPRGGFIGLRIEMKRRKERATADQERWMRDLSAYGHRCVLCDSWEGARDVIIQYLGMPRTVAVEYPTQ